MISEAKKREMEIEIGLQEHHLDRFRDVMNDDAFEELKKKLT